MNLSLIYKIYGAYHIIGALLFGFASSMLSQSSGWGEVTIGITTMSEHFGSALLVIGVITWMLPSWTTEEQLKKATVTIIGLQAILTLVPIYHAGVGAIPSDGMFYISTIVNFVFIGLFYWKSR